MSNPAILAPFGFLVGFPLLWIAIGFLLSRVSGWASLATYYATDTKPEGERYGSQSMSLGFSRFLMASYGNCITFHISETHLYLRPMILFRMGHKMLAIPLDHIQTAPGSILSFNVMNIKIKNVSNIKGRVFGSFGDDLHEITSRL